jgi:hypothetical protein
VDWGIREPPIEKNPPALFWISAIAVELSVNLMVEKSLTVSLLPVETWNSP